MFGREMNTFENWSNRLLPNEEAALINRGNEIRELVERTQPDAVQNIEKQQEKQEKIQNNAHNVDQTPLASGQSVYVKNDGLLTKLEPRYRGPYTVIKQTATGNYKLKDATGEAVKFTVPRHKIKKVENLHNEKVLKLKKYWIIKKKQMDLSSI
jgi:3-deoxy-D-manno-octulosonic-acid transferase